MDRLSPTIADRAAAAGNQNRNYLYEVLDPHWLTMGKITLGFLTILVHMCRHLTAITVKSPEAAIYLPNASPPISSVFYMATSVWVVYCLKRKNLSDRYLITMYFLYGVANFYGCRVKASPIEFILLYILLLASSTLVLIAWIPYDFLVSNVFCKAEAVYDYFFEDGFSVVSYGTRLINSVRQLIRTVCSAPSSVSWEIRKYLIGTNVNGKRKIVSWKLGDELGRGSYGTAYKATDQDGRLFAIKVICTEYRANAAQSELDIMNEVSLMLGLKHQNIVQYYGTDRRDNKLYIFLELVVPGSLEKLYRMRQLQDPEVSWYTVQILYGLIYLHGHNILHRDLKCANILFDARHRCIKLADFGIAKKIDIEEGTKSCKGTLYWMAPEVIRKEAYGPPADIWSLGCTVLEMLTRTHPYPELEPIAAGFQTFTKRRPPIPSTLSDNARDFIDKCLQVKCEDRPSAVGLLEHPFVQGPSFWV